MRFSLSACIARCLAHGFKARDQGPTNAKVMALEHCPGQALAGYPETFPQPVESVAI